MASYLYEDSWQIRLLRRTENPQESVRHRHCPLPARRIRRSLRSAKPDGRVQFPLRAYASVAQLAEQRTLNPEVVGSWPVRCTEADWFNGRTPGSEPEDRSSILLSAAIGLSSNGRTQDFDSCGAGSSPADPGNLENI